MSYIKGTKTFTSKHIGQDIVKHLKNKEPFSLIRLGDADLRLMQRIDKVEKFKRGEIGFSPIGYIKKFRQQGIEPNKIPMLYDIYREACNNANYVSGFDCWLDTNNYWYRNTASDGALNTLKNWRNTYKRMNITNENYCNPDINFHLFMNANFNLLNFLKGKTICLVTPWIGALNRLKNAGYSVHHIRIPHMNPKGIRIKEVPDLTKPPAGKKWHTDVYEIIKNKIKKKSKKCDIFFIGAGNLGRGYSNHVKECGKVAIDLGKVMDSWHRGEVFGRMKKKFLLDGLTFKLYGESTKYNGKF